MIATHAAEAALTSDFTIYRNPGGLVPSTRNLRHSRETCRRGRRRAGATLGREAATNKRVRSFHTITNCPNCVSSTSRTLTIRGSFFGRPLPRRIGLPSSSNCCSALFELPYLTRTHHRRLLRLYVLRHRMIVRGDLCDYDCDPFRLRYSMLTTVPALRILNRHPSHRSRCRPSRAVRVSRQRAPGVR